MSFLLTVRSVIGVDRILAKVSYLLVEKRPFLPVELLSFVMMPIRIETKKCLSSNVWAYGYDKASRVLSVIFQGNTEYRYLCVPERLYQDLDAAASKGQLIAVVKKMCKAVQIDSRWYSMENVRGPASVSPCHDCGSNGCQDITACRDTNFSLFKPYGKKDSKQSA